MDGWDASGLKAIAAGVAAHAGTAVAVFSAASPALVVVARAADVSLDASAVLKALVARFGGKGGGKPDLAQGGGLIGELPEIVNAARALLARRPSRQLLAPSRCSGITSAPSAARRPTGSPRRSASRSR